MVTTAPGGADEESALITIDEAAPVDISDHAHLEDWIALGLFWTMCFVVFLQFFTRYVLNDSYAWTEEIARYLLMTVIFVGAAMCVRRNRHIHVDFIYRLIPKQAGRVVSTFVDLLRAAFFAYAAVLMWKLMAIIGHEEMTMVKIPMNAIYYFIFGGLVMGALRSLQVTWINWKQGYSILENPEAYMDEGSAV
jgi:TRAP-type C4-dicarboxylate transport system permease small subunit